MKINPLQHIKNICINSILRDYVSKDKKIIFFNYTNDSNDVKPINLKRLRNFSDQSNFEAININKENSYNKVKDILNSLSSTNWREFESPIKNRFGQKISISMTKHIEKRLTLIQSYQGYFFAPIG